MRTTDAELAELLGRNVRGLRNQRGLRQEELAEQLGWSRPKLTELEQGKKPRLTFMDIIALCGELGVSLATLLQGAAGAEARQILGVQRDEVVQAQVDELQSHYWRDQHPAWLPAEASALPTGWQVSLKELADRLNRIEQGIQQRVEEGIRRGVDASRDERS